MLGSICKKTFLPKKCVWPNRNLVGRKALVKLAVQNMRATAGVHLSHHVVEDEAGVGQFEVFEETVQLPAVQCAPRTVEVIPGLGLLPCVVVVLKLGKKETECDLSCWEATDSLIFDEEFTSCCYFSRGLNRHAAAFINPTVSDTLISALLCFTVTPHWWFLGHFISPKLTTGIPDAQAKGLPILMLMQQHKNTTSFTLWSGVDWH